MGALGRDRPLGSQDCCVFQEAVVLKLGGGKGLGRGRKPVEKCRGNHKTWRGDDWPPGFVEALPARPAANRALHD